MSLEEFMPFQLSVVANRVSQSIAKIILRRNGLQMPEWRMLMVLAKFSPCSPQLLVEKTAMDPGRVSRAQQRLVDLRLLRARQDPNDKRKLILELTAKGRAIEADMVPEALDTERRMLDRLDAEERAVFGRVLDKLFRETEDLLHE